MSQTSRPRRITLVAQGTRGDIQPFVALAHALRERGHEPLLGVPPNLVEFVRRCGLPVCTVAGDSKAILESDEGRKWLSSGNVRAFFRALDKAFQQFETEFTQNIADAAAQADLVVANILTDDVAHVVCDARKIPLVVAHTMPLLPTSEAPNLFVSNGWVPTKTLRRLTHTLANGEAWKSRVSMVNAIAAKLGVTPHDRLLSETNAAKSLPYLQLYSEKVSPRPSDWHEGAAVTGFLRLQTKLREALGEQPSRALIDWLRAGEAPVFLGFGSMPVLDPAALLQSAVSVGQELGVRTLIGAGWSQLESLRATLPSTAFIVDSVDHEWLFPQCSAVVHHGGAGTTMTGLEAGRPTMICSVFADQPYWGARVEKLGVGRHVPFSKLDRSTLLAGVAALRSPAVRERAEALGQQLRAEDGVARAVSAIEAILQRTP
jgi:sterol 3beta-glucosyltransferase